MATLYRLDVQVGTKWIPAIKEPVSKQRAEQLKRSYATARPHARTRTVPVERPEDGSPKGPARHSSSRNPRR